jgi:hypothetical protein
VNQIISGYISNRKDEEMKTRSILLMVLVLAFATVAMAADPIIGSWKLNIAKSSFAKGQTAPKQMTEVYREASQDQIELTYKSAETNESSTLLVIIIPAQGGVNKRVKGDNAGNMEVETRLAPNEWCMTRLQNGKQIFTLHKLISKDGNSMRRIETGTDAQGKAYQNILILEKQ